MTCLLPNGYLLAMRCLFPPYPLLYSRFQICSLGSLLAVFTFVPVLAFAHYPYVVPELPSARTFYDCSRLTIYLPAYIYLFPAIFLLTPIYLFPSILLLYSRSFFCSRCPTCSLSVPCSRLFTCFTHVYNVVPIHSFAHSLSTLCSREGRCSHECVCSPCLRCSLTRGFCSHHSLAHLARLRRFVPNLAFAHSQEYFCSHPSPCSRSLFLFPHGILLTR